jgi:His-Xaa-Ser system radical SAM maturase HxsC
MRLHTAGTARGFRKPIVARVTTEPIPASERKDAVLVLPSLDSDAGDFRGYAAIIVKQEINGQIRSTPVVHSVRDIDHFSSGHVVVLEAANGFIRTLYRPESRHNTLFVTERCNSNCLMCSQPPIDKDDVAALTERNLKLIDLMSPAPEYLCITGGEPTLLDEHLLTIVAKLRDTLPCTYVHMLTNGRRFAWADFTSRFAGVRHPNLSVGIPLYADHAALHDYVVQARSAFDQTILGLHQLARHGVETEIRVVLHALTAPRLNHLAEYICRNLTFVDHVAFMGMEHIGYAPRNMNDLWIDPLDYQDQLENSVTTLSRFGIEARIYNLQLCVLRRSLWKYSKQSISDWKNAYRDVCGDCAARNRCGGFFQWTTKMQSRGIHCIRSSEL